MSKCLLGKEEEAYFRWKGSLSVLGNGETFEVVKIVLCEEEMRLVR